MPNRIGIILAILAFAVLIVFGGLYARGGVLTSPTPEPSTTLSPVPQTMRTVKVYLVKLDDDGKSGKKIGCGDSLVSVDKEVKGDEVLRLALEELLSIKEQNITESGLYNALYQSNLKVDRGTIENGKVTINLSGEVVLGGVCDDPRFEEQIRATVMQFPTIKEADIFINGKTLKEVVSEK